MHPVKSAYSIGDVHGEAKLLEVTINGIETHAAARGIVPVIYFHGDLTDRGPQSREVIDLVIQTLDKWNGSRLILGNHDEWFLETMRLGDQYQYADSWIMNGGVQTILSYCDGEFRSDCAQLIRSQYPTHLETLRNAKRLITNGGFINVHAGIDPTLPITKQRMMDLNWIRDPFLNYVDPKLPPVIHGHTIMGPDPVVTENRISIDTGAYATGKLTTCFVDAENKAINLFQAEGNSFHEVQPKLLDRGYGTIYDRLDEVFGDPQTVLAPLLREERFYLNS